MCQTIWLCFLGCVHVNVWIYRKSPPSTGNGCLRGTGHSEWPTKVKGTGSEIPPGGIFAVPQLHSVGGLNHLPGSQRSLTKHLHQNCIISPPKYMRALKKKSPKKKTTNKKKKGSGSKPLLFLWWKWLVGRHKSFIAFLSQPLATHPPHPPAQQHGWDLERSFVQRRNLWAKRSVLEGGEGKHLGDFNEAVHPSISPMLRLFRFGVSQKKQQKPWKKFTELPHFIPFLISFQPLWVAQKTPSSTLPPYHIRKFLSLDRFHIRQLRGHDDLTASRLRTRSQGL